jgi:2,5-dihydroxypyridine 5,6-dioxygenase
MLRMPEINYRRLFPSQDMIRRTIEGAKMMTAAEEIRITSSTGTDLILRKNGRKGSGQYGVADVPGRWDNFGFGLVSCAPIEDTGGGTLVIDTGDYLHSLQLAATDPVKLTLKDGKITDFSGGWTASLLRDWFSKWDEDTHRPAHVGWGTHIEGAEWVGSQFLTVADLESYPGLMMLAFGHNYFDTDVEHCGLGGSNHGQSHMDIMCLNHNFYLDGEVIVKNGTIVNERCL